MVSTDKRNGLLAAEPRRRKRKNTLLLVVGTVLLLFSIAAGTMYLVTRPITLRIAVGPPDSDDRGLIQALVASFAHDRAPVQLSLIVTPTALDAIALLAASNADIAVARADIALPRDARSLAVLRKNVVVLWAPSGVAHKGGTKPRPKIRAIGDLAGRHLGLIGRSEDNIKLLNVILAESGVAVDKVKVSQFGIDQIAQMAHDPALDAFMTVGARDSRITSEAITLSASARGEPVFLPVDASDAIVQRHPLYGSETIPQSSFGASPARPADEVETVSVNHLIIARSTLSDAAASAFTQHLLAARQGLTRDNRDTSKIEKPDTDKDAAIPAHPGAAAFVDGTERTFLEKYSDYFWGGLLLLSVLGSAAAWLGHYLKRDEKDLNTLHRDRLLSAIATVRNAGSIGDLITMQSDVDAILRETLDCYDDGAIDEGDLMAFDLVLTQFHQAIVDRRAELSAAIADPPRLRML
ncbi:TAXI family TRAP transporter solute-binding subunit [Tardiphaga sp. P9-11]|uniref:TAXI family TRAP transporter solute-binding subunit n=1 Tax=Tardiphaga sp. P9-11 TaxID=2024614 RepID=UPI0011F19F1E|nr:TAXI family TRAP transporter solute-binding subunit [Tardiphaga sp. P9-11]KAA0074698.1 TRAP transporter substrate-binding protein [Tardiphaga sp. P9-11]